MATILEQRRISKQKTRQRSLRILKRVPLWLYGFVALALVLACMLQFHSWVSVGPRDSQDRPDAFDTPFYVADSGYLSLLRVSVECDFVKRDGTHLAPIVKTLGNLTFKDRQTLPCAVNLGDDPGPRSNVQFTVKVEYRVTGLPLRRSQTFRFKSVTLPDGRCLWLPQ